MKADFFMRTAAKGRMSAKLTGTRRANREKMNLPYSIMCCSLCCIPSKFAHKFLKDKYFGVEVKRNEIFIT